MIINIKGVKDFIENDSELGINNMWIKNILKTERLNYQKYRRFESYSELWIGKCR